MPLASDLSKYVDTGVRNRGTHYFRSGAVRIKAIQSDSVAAEVEGSELYNVGLELDGKTVLAVCTCPYADGGEPCKHIWATILASESRGFARGVRGPFNLTLEGVLDDVEDDVDYETPRYSRSYNPSPPRPQSPPSPRRETWKQQLATLKQVLQPVDTFTRPFERRAERQLVYVIDAAASATYRKLVIELQLQDLKKDGTWGKPRAQSLSGPDIQHLKNPLEKQLLALLGGAERSDSYASYYNTYGVSRYRVAGPLLDAVLPLLSQIDRLRFRRTTTPPVLEPLLPDLEPPWELQVGITRNDSGTNWIVEGKLHRGTESMDVTTPDLIVPGVVVHDGHFTRLNDSGAFAWVTVLRKNGRIEVPIAKSDEFLEQLLQMPGLPRIELPQELQYAEETGTPRPHLKVKAVNTHYSREQALQLDLSFDYAGTIVPLLPAGRGIFQPKSKRFLLRDANAEQAALQELLRRDAVSTWTPNGQKLQMRLNQLPRIVRELVLAGWHVEAEGKLYRKASMFTLAVKSSNDWFDLNAAADFDGQPVALPRLLEALRRGESTVVLDDGTLGMVPEDWLKKFGLFAAMGQIEGDQLRFSKAQVGVLDALLASRPEITFDKQFARAREKLHSFKGVTPADPPKGFHGTLREYQREGLG